MIKKIIFIAGILILPSLHSGILFDTLVQTSVGLKKIQDLNVGDEVISVDKDFIQLPKKIVTIEKKDIDFYIEITMENDETVEVSSDQKLFVPYKWIQADQLSLADILLKNDATLVRIKSICSKQQQSVIYFITVEDNENFFISTNNILIHNGFWGATIGFFTAKFLTHVAGQMVILLIAGAVALVCPPAGYVIGTSLELTFAPCIEATSNVFGLAGGIAGGTLTGPI